MYRLSRPTKDDPAKLADVAVQATALMVTSAQVYLGDKFVCMATNVGHGFWVACYDSIFGTRMGRAEAPPAAITLKSAYAEKPLHIRWSVEIPLRPLLLMRVDVQKTYDETGVYPSSMFVGAPPLMGTMADLYGKEYVKMWRIGYRAPYTYQPEPDGMPYISDGSVVYDVCFGRFRCGSDDLSEMLALHGMGLFGTAYRQDFGSPVVLSDGRLAAVIIGDDNEPRATFIPIDLITPFRDLWRLREENTKSFSSFYFSTHH